MLNKIYRFLRWLRDAIDRFLADFDDPADDPNEYHTMDGEK